MLSLLPRGLGTRLKLCLLFPAYSESSIAFLFFLLVKIHVSRTAAASMNNSNIAAPTEGSITAMLEVVSGVVGGSVVCGASVVCGRLGKVTFSSMPG